MIPMDKWCGENCLCLHKCGDQYDDEDQGDGADSPEVAAAKRDDADPSTVTELG